MALKRFFEWALEPWLRRARGVRPLPMADEELLAVLAVLPDNNPQLRALLDVAHDQFEKEAKALLANNLTPEAVQYQRGRAASLYALMDRIEAARAEAREVRERELGRQRQKEEGRM